MNLPSFLAGVLAAVAVALGAVVLTRDEAPIDRAEVSPVTDATLQVICGSAGACDTRTETATRTLPDATQRPAATLAPLPTATATPIPPLPSPTPLVVYMTAELLGYACTGEWAGGREPGGFAERELGLAPKPCANPIPEGAQIVIIPSAATSDADTETVRVHKHVDYSTVIISRRYGELWLLDYGVGCLSLSYSEGRSVLVYSPGLFAGIGSRIIIPDRDQSCRVWSAERL